jgi:ribonucleotide monophosphatase NagD (HAD superfamily)
MIGAIVAATGKEVELVIGKPSQLMADLPSVHSAFLQNNA